MVVSDLEMRSWVLRVVSDRWKYEATSEAGYWWSATFRPRALVRVCCSSHLFLGLSLSYDLASWDWVVDAGLNRVFLVWFVILGPGLFDCSCGGDVYFGLWCEYIYRWWLPSTLLSCYLCEHMSQNREMAVYPLAYYACLHSLNWTMSQPFVNCFAPLLFSQDFHLFFFCFADRSRTDVDELSFNRWRQSWTIDPTSTQCWPGALGMSKCEPWRFETCWRLVLLCQNAKYGPALLTAYFDWSGISWDHDATMSYNLGKSAAFWYKIWWIFTTLPPPRRHDDQLPKINLFHQVRSIHVWSALQSLLKYFFFTFNLFTFRSQLQFELSSIISWTPNRITAKTNSRRSHHTVRYPINDQDLENSLLWPCNWPCDINWMTTTNSIIRLMIAGVCQTECPLQVADCLAAHGRRA